MTQPKIKKQADVAKISIHKTSAPHPYKLHSESAVKMKASPGDNYNSIGNAEPEPYGAVFSMSQTALDSADERITELSSAIEGLMESLRPYMPVHIYEGPDDEPKAPNPYSAADRSNSPNLMRIADLSNRLHRLRERVQYIHYNVVV